MVDPIGAKTVTTADVAAPRTGVAASAVPASPVRSSGADTAQTQASTLAKSMAAAAPVDSNHVEEIRKAIADGTFPILPATIADRLLALKLDWTSNDKA